MLVVYSFLMLISGITDLWIFFRVSQIAASKKNILILGGVLFLLSILCGGVVELATFLEILFFIFYFRKSKEKNLAIGAILIVGVVDSIIDILSSILMELLHIEDIIYLNLLVQISIILLAVFIIEIFYKYLHSYLMNENHNVFIGLLIYLYVSTTLTMIFYGQTQKNASLSMFFTIFVLIQIVFAMATYVELINIQKHLLNCEEIYILCVTLGLEIDRTIRTAMITSPDKGVILNSCATAAAEQLADITEQEITELCRQEGKHTTWRFSAGYGDLPLESQKDIITVMDTHRKIGVSLTDSLLMTPSKSVTAIIGVTDTTTDLRKNKCDYCSNRNDCLFRKRGTLC